MLRQDTILPPSAATPSGGTSHTIRVRAHVLPRHGRCQATVSKCAGDKFHLATPLFFDGPLLGANSSPKRSGA